MKEHENTDKRASVTNWHIRFEFDDNPLSDKENRRAEEMLNSLWLGLCLLPDDVDNLSTVTREPAEVANE
jgi:hypothetical protein